jgi:hypothetical protein
MVFYLAGSFSFSISKPAIQHRNFSLMQDSQISLFLDMEMFIDCGFLPAFLLNIIRQVPL